jgi:hypothetical protein
MLQAKKHHMHVRGKMVNDMIIALQCAQTSIKLLAHACFYIQFLPRPSLFLCQFLPRLCFCVHFVPRPCLTAFHRASLYVVASAEEHMITTASNIPQRSSGTMSLAVKAGHHLAIFVHAVAWGELACRYGQTQVADLNA